MVYRPRREPVWCERATPLPPIREFASVSKSTAVLADAVDPRAIGTGTMRAMHYRYQYNPDALAAPALLQSYSLLLQRWATSLPYLNPSMGGGDGMRSVWVWLHHAYC